VLGALVVGTAGIPVAIVNTAVAPLLFAAAPPEYLGRVIAVFNPANQFASMLSTVAAGWLMSTVLVGFHAEIGGMHVGPIDTIFTIVGLLFVASSAYGFVSLPKLGGTPAAEA
jgi:hypothetical protein